MKRSLKPIQDISETARQIGKENDLKKRIDIGTERYQMEPVDMTELVSSLCADMALSAGFCEYGS